MDFSTQCKLVQLIVYIFRRYESHFCLMDGVQVINAPIKHLYHLYAPISPICTYINAPICTCINAPMGNPLFCWFGVSSFATLNYQINLFGSKQIGGQTYIDTSPYKVCEFYLLPPPLFWTHVLLHLSPFCLQFLSDRRHLWLAFTRPLVNFCS